ncbi:hypothetical protein RD110_22080 [Rhodoferax koreense]|uniref:Histidine kinase/HSP90-like ATPase domain-containing protein n=1 Tax=Rhodoferax koreensis TaxID=1842727 RepID=A0A1P8K0N4_9BURK|nr:hypothetical protein RD110_22080 [Rhodoferax koreense]
MRAIVRDRTGRPTRVVYISRQAFGRVLIDRDGGLLASTTRGLARIGDALRLLEPDGERELMSNSLMATVGESPTMGVAYTMLEDHDGNIWIGSSAGLDRFRDSKFTPVRGPDTSFTYSVAAGPGNSILAANWNSGLLKIEGHSRVTTVENVGPQISALYTDPSGSVWAASPSKLWHSDAYGDFKTVPVPPRLLQPWVSNMAMDTAGDIWLSSNTLVRRSGTGEWSSLPRDNGFGDRSAPRAMLADPAGGTWLSRGSDIIRIEDGVPRDMVALSKRVQVGAIQSFAQRNGHLWIAGLNGVALMLGNEVLNLKVATGPPFSQISAVLETREGDLWVRGADDAWLVNREELRRVLVDKHLALEVEHFDALDGLASAGLRTKSMLAQAGDGTIWFGTRQGLAWIDPKQLARPTVAPRLRVKYVTVDGTMRSAKEPIVLPPLSHRLEIAYTALELGYPERIEFKFKLEGFDREWQSAAGRRIAYYNDLPPGNYHFRFMSTDRTGRWHEDPADHASVEIRAMPAWFETFWSKVAAVILMVLIIGSLFRLRMRHVTSQLQKKLSSQVAEQERIARARQDERDRIARDLHDTLIQSTQGLIYIFQGLADRVVTDEGTRIKLDNALVRANEVAIEGRDMIEDLRLPVNFAPDLARAFEEIASEVGEGRGTQFDAAVKGTVQKIEASVYEAVCRIGREALINAFRHSRATLIRVQIEYGKDNLSLSVKDDGIGLPVEMRYASRIPGHWGIQGMRERADRIGASFQLLADTEGGTEMRLTIPASEAYTALAKASFRA